MKRILLMAAVLLLPAMVQAQTTPGYITRAGGTLTGPLTAPSLVATSYPYKDAGAVGDALTGTAAISLGTPHLVTISQSLFTSAAVGKTIYIAGAGASGGPLVTTISSYASPTQADITTAASTAVSAAGAAWGTDNAATIQAAMNALSSSTFGGTQGGGKVLLGAGNYLITSTLYVPNGVVLQGVSSGGYPYFQPTNRRSVLIPAFSNVNSWVIDTPAYSSSGTALAYNDFTTTTDTFVFGVAVKNLDINTLSQTSSPIYGGIRMAFAPDSALDTISINGNNLGIAIALTESNEASIRRVHSLSNYFGAVVANNTNIASMRDCVFDEVWEPSQLTVPSGMITDIFDSSFATYISEAGLDSSHATSAKGVVLWNNENGGTYSFEAQNWPDTLFLGDGVYGMNFPIVYTEGNASGAGTVGFFYTGTHASANIGSTSAYQVNYMIDSGYDDRLSIHVNEAVAVANLIDNVSQQSLSGGDHTALTIFDWPAIPGSQPARVNILNGPSGENSLAPTTAPTVSITGAVSESPTADVTNMTFGYSSHFGEDEGDFYNNHYGTATNFGYMWWQMNSAHTGYNLLGGVLQNGTWELTSLQVANAISAASLRSQTYTVSTLPAASSLTAGTQVVVTDATTFTPGACTGGGSDTMIAVTNGSTWSCH